MVKERVTPVTPEHGDGGGLSTTANTPPAAREAVTNAIMTISLVLTNHTGTLARHNLPAKNFSRDPLIEPSSIRSTGHWPGAQTPKGRVWALQAQVDHPVERFSLSLVWTCQAIRML